MISGLHIEPTNICTLKCPGCARTRFLDQWPQHWKNHSLDIDQLLKFLDIDLSNLDIVLCGNYGDPIYHPDLIDFVTKLKQRNARITINTNGSYKTKLWWQQLTDALTDQDLIIFSIDGIPKNFNQYRINADWSSIQTGIKVVATSAVKTQWKYIPFSYNENDIDTAQQLSIDLGIDEFLVELSDRFDDQTAHLRPSNNLLSNRYDSQLKWKSDNSGAVDPKCQTNRSHYISADGHYIPCCYLADHRFYYKTQFGKNKIEYSIVDQTLGQILSAPKVVEFYQNLDQQPGCQYNCPKLASTNLT